MPNVVKLICTIALSGCLSSLLYASLTEKSYNIMCFYNSDSEYYEYPANLSTGNIDASSCTHLVYAYATLDENYQITVRKKHIERYEIDKQLKAFNSHKDSHPQLKTMVSVSVLNHIFGQMTAQKDKRKIFIESVVKFIETYGFDGLNIFVVSCDPSYHSKVVCLSSINF